MMIYDVARQPFLDCIMGQRYLVGLVYCQLSLKSELCVPTTRQHAMFTWQPTSHFTMSPCCTFHVEQTNLVHQTAGYHKHNSKVAL